MGQQSLTQLLEQLVQTAMFFGTDFLGGIVGEFLFPSEVLPPLNLTAACRFADANTSSNPCPLSELSTTEFTLIHPGGRTSCLFPILDGKDNPFFFTAKPGVGDDANNLVLYFQGGSLCFDTDGCFPNAPASPTQTPDPQGGGLFNLNSSVNPFLNWGITQINYCSGDGHVGNATSEDGQVQLRGRENVLAAIQWAKRQWPNPDRVFVGGCSSGAVGAQYWADYIVRLFPSSTISVAYDSFLGEFYQFFPFRQGFSKFWKACDAPDEILQISEEERELCRTNQYTLVDWQQETQERHRNIPFLYLSHKRDIVTFSLYCVLSSNFPCRQPIHYAAMQQTMRDFTLLDNETDTEDDEDSLENNVLSYWINDIGHCILEDEGTFYRVGIGFGTITVNLGLGALFDFSLLSLNFFFFGEALGLDMVSYVRNLAYRDPVATILQSQCFSRQLFVGNDDFGCDRLLRRARFIPEGRRDEFLD